MKLFEMWPNFLQEITEFQAIAEAQQPEFDEAGQAVRSMNQEFHLFTMTEYGCGRWEAILGITPGTGESVESRRQKILTRYLSQLPYTYRRLLQHLAQTTQGYMVDLDAANYRLFVQVKLAGYSQRTALLAVITEMIPANLVLRLQALIPQQVEQAKLTAAALMLTQTRHISEPIQR